WISGSVGHRACGQRGPSRSCPVRRGRGRGAPGKTSAVPGNPRDRPRCHPAMRRSTRRGGLAGLVSGLVVLAVGGRTGGGQAVRFDGGPPPGDPGPRAAPFRLVTFSSCGDLLRRLKDAAEQSVGPYGFGYPVPMAPGAAEDRAAAPAPGAPAAPGAATAPEHSTTNVQEAGVDEPD